MKFWRSRSDIQRELIDVMKDEIRVLRSLQRQDRERIDRLTEALARKGGVDLVFPVDAPSPEPIVFTPNPWKDPNQVTLNFKENKQ